MPYLLMQIKPQPIGSQFAQRAEDALLTIKAA